jgi:hypothetical protein
MWESRTSIISQINHNNTTYSQPLTLTRRFKVNHKKKTNKTSEKKHVNSFGNVHIFVIQVKHRKYNFKYVIMYSGTTLTSEIQKQCQVSFSVFFIIHTCK